MALRQLVCLLLGLHFTRCSQARAAEDSQQPLAATNKKPNMVFILTDDQDLHMDSLSYMPFLKKHITDQGTSFDRHYCTVALCCPSRVSLWTGKAAHNTNVTDVNPPHGGYPKFISQGFNSAYLPLWLQAAGYNTYYTGKLFNAQTVDNYATPHAAGWTSSDFLLDPYTYEYLNATFQRNHDEPVSYEGQYSTDVLAQKAYGLLDEALEGEEPFFLTIAPTAPHSNVHMNFKNVGGEWTPSSATQSPPIPAERHKHLFSDMKVPRTPHFNPGESNGVSWISRLPQQNETNVEFNDHFYRSRLRALQSVDELIDEVFSRLEEAGVLDNTYVFFSTDNGYHIGQHRLQPGKQCAYEEDINIPFIVRGPGVPEGETTSIVTSHTDLAPTFLHLAGVSATGKLFRDYELDGAVIPLTAAGIEVEKEEGKRGEHVNVEMWGVIMSEGDYGSVLYENHTYKALRVVSEEYNLLYTVWCSGEHELYDLKKDPYEMENLYPLTTTSRGHYAHLVARLDTLLVVLKTCKGRECTHPWETLHPLGDVLNLQDALASTYDEFYEDQQERVYWTQCESAYIAGSEGPDRARSYGGMEFEMGV